MWLWRSLRRHGANAPSRGVALLHPIRTRRGIAALCHSHTTETWVRSARGLRFVSGRVGFVWRAGLGSIGARASVRFGTRWVRSARGCGFVRRDGIVRFFKDILSILPLGSFGARRLDRLGAYLGFARHRWQRLRLGHLTYLDVGFVWRAGVGFARRGDAWSRNGLSLGVTRVLIRAAEIP